VHIAETIEIKLDHCLDINELGLVLALWSNCYFELGLGLILRVRVRLRVIVWVRVKIWLGLGMERQCLQ